MQNPLNCGMSGCQNYPIRIMPPLSWQNLGAPIYVFVFLVFVFLREKINFKIWRPSDLGKSEKKPVQKQSNCDDVCKVCQVNLKVTYGKYVAKACGNIFKPSARKQIFGVVLSESLKSFGITVIASYIDSQLACIDCPCLTCMQLIYNTSHQTSTE